MKTYKKIIQNIPRGWIENLDNGRIMWKLSIHTVDCEIADYSIDEIKQIKEALREFIAEYETKD